MEKQIIGRGLLAGVVAGVLAFVFARIFVEPVIERAIDYEDGIGAAHEAMETAAGTAAHSHGEGGGFSRAIQMNIGMGLGVLLFSVAMAALFAVVFTVAFSRMGGKGGVSARLLSVYVAGGMLVSLYLVPFLKYPASPPALSLDETIRQRTLLYLLMAVLSAASFVGAVLLGRRLVTRLGAWNATWAAAGAYVVAVAVLMLVLPGIHETPGPLVDDAGVIVYEGFPADVLYDFRLYSLGMQVVMWAAIAGVFAPLASRLLDGRRPEFLSSPGAGA
ncbi:CbtA family protein [Mycolicibacterium sp. S2-37]|uniref:CbtA family protein n=1 Tax=Mycolicibacterium sp. S2-37 TaxID=2810297 RepID=UPI001A93CCCB|nr:CbtA family protein [Mycolicibacterium sp. S2-37]MBO0680777.1 CbtA family protein [Mycolicibacterium sp. S2-37]